MPGAVRLGCILALAGMWSTSTASAQICTGRAPFNSAPTQIGASAALSGRAHTLGGTAGRGTDRLFGLARFEVQRTEQDGRWYWVDIAAGADQPLTLNNRLHICPMAGAGYGWRGPKGNAVRMSGQLSLGLMAANTRTAAVIPSIAVRADHHWPISSPPPFADTRSTAAIRAGVGIVFTNGLSIGSTVDLPVHAAAGSIMLGAALVYSLPRR